jgi:hypothetical protein
MESNNAIVDAVETVETAATNTLFAVLGNDVDVAIEGAESFPHISSTLVDSEQGECYSDTAAGNNNDLNLPSLTALNTHPRPAMSELHDATTTLTSNLHRSSTEAAATLAGTSTLCKGSPHSSCLG